MEMIMKRNENVRKRIFVRIRGERNLSEHQTNRLFSRMEKLVDHLQHSHAIVAYHRMNGDFCLHTATLKNYRKVFRKPFTFEQLSKGILIFWCEERKMWLNLHIENFMEWRAVQ